MDMNEYKTWLKEAGVDLPDHRLERLAAKIAKEFEQRVGDAITGNLTDAQLDHFEQILHEAHQKQLQWLHEHYPNYSEIVEQEAAKLRQELASAKNPAVLLKQWQYQEI